MERLKQCTRCLEWKMLDCFFKEKRTKIGLQCGQVIIKVKEINTKKKNKY